MNELFNKKFWGKVIRRNDNECWGWIGNTTTTQNGGTFEFKGTRVSARKASWIVNFGNVPNDKVVRNACGNEYCVNPYHLMLINKSEWNKDTRSIEQKFWDNVHITDGCWEWTGTKFTEGYGSLWNGKKNIKAHRISWMIAHGEMPPDNLYVCHHCDNPSCVNPNHLFLGTSKDNILDMMNKGRGNFICGEKQPNHKLTTEDVLLIRKLYRLGASTQIQLAKDFNMSFQQISRIVNNQRWTHIL